MTSALFDSFCRMVETIPPKAVLRAAEAERKMVEDDLVKQRTPETEEAVSVLGFCNYVLSAARGIQFAPPAWPLEHCAFYRKVVRRLVEAGELPQEARTLLDSLFLNALKHALMSPG